MDVGGTIPWMESVESRLERRPRATHGDKAEAGIQFIKCVSVVHRLKIPGFINDSKNLTRFIIIKFYNFKARSQGVTNATEDQGIDKGTGTCWF